MKSGKPYRQRKSPRLSGYDYSQDGAYFVTICTYQGGHFFGPVVEGQMQLTPIGQVAERCWRAIPDHFPAVELDEFVVMPNHLHGILWLRRSKAALGTIVGNFKAAVTRESRRDLDPELGRLWHRSYHDHIIRTEQDLMRIRKYIKHNPQRWQEDKFFIHKP